MRCHPPSEIARQHGEPGWPALIRPVDALGRELLDAARDGQVEAVYRLLEQGAPPNARDPESGNTALHLAAARGRPNAIDYLVGWLMSGGKRRSIDGQDFNGALHAREPQHVTDVRLHVGERQRTRARHARWRARSRA